MPEQLSVLPIGPLLSAGVDSSCTALAPLEPPTPFVVNDRYPKYTAHRFALATLDLVLLLFIRAAALMISSARHSAMVFTLWKAASLAPVQSKYSAMLTRRKGDMSTACLLTTPAEPDARRVLAGTGLDDGLDEHLHRVLVREEVHNI